MKNTIIAVLLSLTILSVLIYIINNMQVASLNRGDSVKNDSLTKETNSSSVSPDGKASASFFDKLTVNEIMKLLIAIKKENQKTEIPKLPKSMSEVKMTPALKEYLDARPGMYETLDYKLGVFDRLSSCLGDKEPKTGYIKVGLYFDLDRDVKIASGVIGSGDNPPIRVYAKQFFDVDREPLGQDDQDNVLECLYGAHFGYTFDATISMASGSLHNIPINEIQFEIPVGINFPIKDDDLYRFLENGPELNQ